MVAGLKFLRERAWVMPSVMQIRRFYSASMALKMAAADKGGEMYMIEALVVEEQELVEKCGCEDVRTHKREKGEQAWWLLVMEVMRHA